MKIILIFVRKKSSYICSKEFLYLSKMNWFLKMKKLLILVPKKLIFPKEKKLLYFLVNNFCKVLYFRCVFNTAAFFFMRPKLNRVLNKTNETPSLRLNLYGKIFIGSICFWMNCNKLPRAKLNNQLLKHKPLALSHLLKRMYFKKNV